MQDLIEPIRKDIEHKKETCTYPSEQRRIRAETSFQQFSWGREGKLINIYMYINEVLYSEKKNSHNCGVYVKKRRRCYGFQ